MLKMILIGNAGSGKSTLARKIMSGQSAARLSLDVVAFQDVAERRPMEGSIADVRCFMAGNES